MLRNAGSVSMSKARYCDICGERYVPKRAAPHNHRKGKKKEDRTYDKPTS